MRFIKRKLAMILAVLLMLPVQPVLADDTSLQSVVTETAITESKDTVVTELPETTLPDEDESQAEEKSKDVTEEFEEETKDSEEEPEESSRESEKEEESEKVSEESEKQTEDSEKEPEESSKESEKAEESEEQTEESGKEAEETGKDSKKPAESENGNKDESENKLVNQIISAVQNKIQQVVNSEKKPLLADLPVATPSKPAKVKTAEDEVKFNTGKHVYSVVSKDDFFDNEIGDAYFEEDGSYTINIPEENPFFPYEVQFTYKGKTLNEWFMTPDDSVKVGGHTFYVSAYFDGTVVTQISFDVAGDTVVVYPEKKKFTDTEEGMIDPASLLPLEEKSLNVDLMGYTPLELTQVLIDSIFTGEAPLQNGQKVAWKYSDYDKSENYTVSSIGDKIDLSRYTYNGGGNWEMIVGDGDQLTDSNIRYIVRINVTKSEKWLVPTVYTQGEDGKRNQIPVLDLGEHGYKDYYDYDPDERELRIRVSSKALERDKDPYIGLKVNSSLFGNQPYDHLKAYEGEYEDPQSAEAGGKDITDQILAKDMTKKDAGYILKPSSEQWVTLVAYDASGKAVACLSFELWLSRMGNGVSWRGLYDGIGPDRSHIWNSSKSSYSDGCNNLTLGLDYGYAIDKEYYFVMEYSREGVETPSAVTAAYAGKYASIGEAVKAGAADIKEALFDDSNAGGYKADYSKGVYFTVFVGEDGSQAQEVYKYNVKVEEGERRLSGNTLVYFYALKDADGKNVPCYVVDEDEDSYADNTYITILVKKDADLTNLAPVFTVQKGLKLYADDGKEQISGKSSHDFSKGPVQYTASSENKEKGRNYWLQIVKPVEGEGKLYINSLKDPDAHTETANGVTTSVREMVIDGRSDYQHDILLINVGSGAIDGLTAEIQSDSVELDSYWKLTGNNSLQGFPAIEEDWGLSSAEFSNMAKLRIRGKEGVESGEDITGTLTIKSGNKNLIILNLTGTIGDPSITTKEIPGAVKYVPYGVMIQNNNKYDWNDVTYRITNGALPAGVSLMNNGEIYGVPTEAGEFKFTVQMRNSYSSFKNSEKEFTLTVLENTDANVDGSTDPEYTLSQRIPDIGLNSTGDYLLVSQGEYVTFRYIFLDGVKLQEGVDYTSEAGSTRITIRSQTLKASNKTGVHTLGIEFRTGKTTEGTKKTSDLKRAAQNYRVTTRSSGSSSGVSSGGGSSYRGGGSSGSIVVSRNEKDPKKGYVNTDKGIITGDQAGYSRWQQDETGWKLLYADGTVAGGYMTTLESGETVEQIVWEKINGSWYAFGADGYIKSGWVYDYRLRNWYSLSADTGMLSGWYMDPVDQNTYYLDPAEGGLSTGWRNIETKWYYFNNVVTEPTWELNKETNKWQYNAKSKSKPYGAMLRNEKTPDGYEVNADGVWIEK